MSAVEFTVPVRTVSRTNVRESHWTRAKREKATREAVLVTHYAQTGRYYAPSSTLPCRVLLTRVAPSMLDDDNVRGALKSCRDEVATILGVDDRDPRVSWAYAQERGGVREYAVRVRITPGLGALHEWLAIPAESRAAIARSVGGLAGRVLEEVAG